MNDSKLHEQCPKNEMCKSEIYVCHSNLVFDHIADEGLQNSCLGSTH